MGEKIIFTTRVPERISGINIWSDLVIFALALLLVFLFIAYDYLVGVLVVTVIFLFYLPRIKIKSIDNSIKMCQEVIKENKEISEKDKAIENHLLIEDGFIAKSKHRIISLYIMAGIFLPLYLVINSFNPSPLLKSLNLLIYVTSLLTGLAIYDLKGILKYFETILYRNKEKIFSEEKLKSILKTDSIPSFNYYQKKLNIITIVVVIIAIFILVAFFSKKITDVMLVIIPMLYITLSILIIYDIKKITMTSLEILHQYDDYVKSKFGLIYKPVLTEKQKGFISIFVEEFKTNFGDRQKKSSKIIDKFKNKGH